MEKNKFLRIGTVYYKVVELPLPSGDTKTERKVWTYETIRQDYGKDYIAQIPKYDGFCIIPSHLDYKPVIGEFLNLYEPLECLPIEGNCQVTLGFIRHIFGEHYELGLDYMQLLYMKPITKLPILVLVSKENNTGKSTFLNLLKMIFGKNMTFNTNEDFRSQFNSDWANKLIIGVDETLLNRMEDTERIKNLSTAFTYKIEGKGKDRAEIEFFGKFVFCSNNEDNALYISPGETRFWVRKIHPLTNGDPLFLRKLKSEIPAFLYFLKNRALYTKQESRMWFRLDLFQTEALKRMISYNRNKTECDLREMMLEIMETLNIDHFEFALIDLQRLFPYFSKHLEHQQVKKILQTVWNLNKTSNSFSYETYEYNYNSESGYSLVKRKGRYYSVTKDFLLAL